MRFLIVDDSGTMRKLIHRVMVVTGVPDGDIVEACDGASALDVLEHDRIDVLLTDIHMPGMTGVDLLRALASDPRWAGLTRVVISTDGSASRRDEVEQLGVRCYVEKPFSPEVMRDVLETLTPAASHHPHA